jgi:hypothetical protein
MKRRQSKGVRPQITFTSDFHELVQGDLLPGPCALCYDPLRLIELGDSKTETHTIRAYVRFHPQNTEWQGEMTLPAGLPLAEQADIAGQGVMLETAFTIPPGCDELEIWFSCTHEDQTTHWDSDFGKNHWLRFGLADLEVVKAIVRDESAVQDAFECSFTSLAKVDSLAVRWRLTNFPATPRETTPLEATVQPDGSKLWAPAGGFIPVPLKAVVAFDVTYTVAGRVYTDDNQGRWYIADID